MLIREAARPIAGKLIALGAVVSVLLGARWIAFGIQDVGPVAASARSAGDDALWLSHLWVDGRKDQADVDALAASLRGTGIRDLFVHVGPLDSDGTLNPALRPKARWLVGAIHAALPGVRLQAWIGDTVPPTGSLDLESPATRARIVTGVRSVIADGFDGVHFDFEPVGDADPGFLDLLDEARPVLHAAGRILSVSAEQVEPVSGSRWIMEALEGHDSWWSAAYLHQVAERVDEVAIMSYDTALWSRSSYTGFVRDETLIALAAVPPEVTLLIGAPAYHTHDLDHDDAAETVGAAVRGVRLALTEHPPGARAVGIALYMDYFATPADWSAYRGDWVDLGTAAPLTPPAGPQPAASRRS